MSLVKDSVLVRNKLHDRLKELYPTNLGYGFKNAEVIKDATERSFKIAPEQLSRYFGDKPKNGLSESQIIWLCIRYGITIKLQVDKPHFNELEALKKLKLIFG